MTDRLRILTGALSVTGGTTSVLGVRVELWRWVAVRALAASSGGHRAQYLGRAFVLADGTFSMEIPETAGDIDRVLLGRDALRSTLRFRVFKGRDAWSPPLMDGGTPDLDGGFGATWTVDAAGAWQAQIGPITIGTPPQMSGLQGVVHHPDGFTIPGLRCVRRKYTTTGLPVETWDSSPQGVTGPDGEFVTTPAADDDLSIVVKDDTDTVLGASPLVEGFSTFARVDVELDWSVVSAGAAPVTEFERYHGGLNTSATELLANPSFNLAYSRPVHRP
jgi:hypothetical protein